VDGRVLRPAMTASSFVVAGLDPATHRAVRKRRAARNPLRRLSPPEASSGDWY
jgi:hypothetical protein